MNVDRVQQIIDHCMKCRKWNEAMGQCIQGQTYPECNFDADGGFEDDEEDE